MARFTRGLVVTLVVLVLGSFVVMLQQKPASGAPGPAPVTVVNTPLPTTVTNTPLPVSGSLAATVSGTVAVNNFPTNQNVSGTVVNTSVNPVPILDVNTSAKEPFQTLLCNAGGSFSGSCPEPVQFVVPSMTTDNLPVKRLVIENVSGICSQGATTQVEAMAVSTFVNENTVNNVSQALALITVLPGVSPAAPTFNGTTRLYADPGATVGLLTYTAGVDSSCTVFVNGYLITK